MLTTLLANEVCVEPLPSAAAKLSRLDRTCQFLAPLLEAWSVNVSRVGTSSQPLETATLNVK